jgi:hypothetical protein
LQARRYFGHERYFSVRYGIGASPFEIRNLNQIGVLNSQSFTSDMNWYIGKWFVSASGGWASQDRINLGLQHQYNLGVSVARKF